MAIRAYIATAAPVAAAVAYASYYLDKKTPLLAETPDGELEDAGLRRLRKQLLGFEINRVAGHWRMQAPAWTATPSDAAGHAALKKDQYGEFLAVMTTEGTQMPPKEASEIRWMKPALVSAVSAEEYAQLVQRDRIFNITSPPSFMPEYMMPLLHTKPRPRPVVARLRGLPGAPVTQQDLNAAVAHLDAVGYSVAPPDPADGQLASQIKGDVPPHRDFGFDLTGFNKVAQRATVEGEFLYDSTAPSILDFFRSEEEFRAARPLYKRVKEPNPPRDFGKMPPLSYIVEFPAILSASTPPPPMATVRWSWRPEQRIASWELSHRHIREKVLNEQVQLFQRALATSGISINGPIAVAISTHNPFLRAFGIRKPRLIASVSDINMQRFAVENEDELRKRAAALQAASATLQQEEDA